MIAEVLGTVGNTIWVCHGLPENRGYRQMDILSWENGDIINPLELGVPYFQTFPSALWTFFVHLRAM